MVEHDETCKQLFICLFGKNKAIKIAKFAAYASFPWKLNRYFYGVQFGINCTALDQSKFIKFVECTKITKMRKKFRQGRRR